jgi:hypothetical protein
MAKAPKNIVLPLLIGCARCMGNHPGIVFKPLTIPGRHSHWAPCPATGEPIMMATVMPVVPKRRRVKVKPWKAKVKK